MNGHRQSLGASGGPTSSAVVSPLGLLPHQVHVTTHQVPTPRLTLVGEAGLSSGGGEDTSTDTGVAVNSDGCIDPQDSVL